MIANERGTLKDTEAHPAAYMALDYLKSVGAGDLFMIQESFSSCAIEGNRLGEVCSETLRRLLNGEPVSDRYLMGLAWAVHKMNNSDKPIKKKRVKK